MLLETYKLTVSPPECLPSSVAVAAMAEFDDDLKDLLPYLNAELRPCVFDPDVPFLRFRKLGRTFAIYADKILINPLADEQEAEKVFQWVRQTINSVADRKQQLRPSTWSLSSLKPLDIFRLLPRTNCGECGRATCMAFAAAVASGEAGPDDCPPLPDEQHSNLRKLFQEE